jgi:hypothetical protein
METIRMPQRVGRFSSFELAWQPVRLHYVPMHNDNTNKPAANKKAQHAQWSGTGADEVPLARGESTLHEALAARGYEARATTRGGIYAKEIVHAATGKPVAAMRAEEAWAWLRGGCANCDSVAHDMTHKCCPECSHLAEVSQ